LMCLFVGLLGSASITHSVAQSWDLTPENIDIAIRDSAIRINRDPFRPAYHLTPPVGCMGDPNGAIYHEGWFHMFYGLQPFAYHPGAWYWAHARSKDLLNWEHMKTGLTPAFDLGLNAIGSGSTITAESGEMLAFYSQSRKGDMEFWRTRFMNSELSEWSHKGKNPVLTLDHPGLPPFDGFWRDPFVFEAEGRTFLIACADLFDENYVPVPIFEAKDTDLTDWEYQGILFTVPKHKYRNLEVPELRRIDNKWIFIASTDAPVDRVIYFLGELDMGRLRFNIESEGIIDHSGHYYAQESFSDDKGRLYQMAWIPGWDREWLPYYMNEPIKNSNPLWNGCFSLPRELHIEDGKLVQKPLRELSKLRKGYFTLNAKNLHVSGPATSIEVVEGFRSDQAEIRLKFDLFNASFCGINLLTDKDGKGGLPITWSGDQLKVDGVLVLMEDWEPGDPLELHIFIDKKIVEVFANEGHYCISRQLQESGVKGKHLALTCLGGTAKLLSFEAWSLTSIN
ncbi:MAG: glycoside hydrolase family 32 protein, partial [Eudoraea sp.]|nr:glycoside hydrolase family 32 protein [Eudoraea sp.]